MALPLALPLALALPLPLALPLAVEQSETAMHMRALIGREARDDR